MLTGHFINSLEISMIFIAFYTTVLYYKGLISGQFILWTGKKKSHKDSKSWSLNLMYLNVGL